MLLRGWGGTCEQSGLAPLEPPQGVPEGGWVAPAKRVEACPLWVWPVCGVQGSGV